MYTDELLDILGSAGPISLEELVARSPNSVHSVMERLQYLKKTGLVSVTGPAADKDFTGFSEAQILSDSETRISLTTKAFRAATA